MKALNNAKLNTEVKYFTGLNNTMIVHYVKSNLGKAWRCLALNDVCPGVLAHDNITALDQPACFQANAQPGMQFQGETVELGREAMVSRADSGLRVAGQDNCGAPAADLWSDVTQG